MAVLFYGKPEVHLVGVGSCRVGAHDLQRAGADKRRIIQLSGIVLGEDGVSGLPGAHVYVPLAGRGTSTQPNVFSMAVMEGDGVVISSVGYVRRHYIVPRGPQFSRQLLLKWLRTIPFEGR